MQEEIKRVTQEFVKQHGIAVFSLLCAVAGVTARTLDYYRSGYRMPDKFLLYFVWRECPDHPLGKWALEILEIRARNGEGLPLGCRGLKGV
jgi:hypothetical protein